MTIRQQLSDRIQAEQKKIDTLNAALPDLRERLRLAEEQADHIEGLMLLNKSDGDVQRPDVSEQHLMNAKRAERDRRRDVERTEREARLATVMHAELTRALQTVKDAKVDEQLANLENQLPKAAKAITDAWLQYEKAALQAEEIRDELQRLKQLVPVRSVRVSLSKPIPTVPDLERIRRTHPRNNLGHPANVLQKLGYVDLAQKLQGR